MSIGFNWFKTYEIIPPIKDYWYDDYSVVFLDGDSTSHSAGNITKVQNLLEKYGGKRIPRINNSWVDSVDYDLELIEPEEMSHMCSRVLATIEVDDMGMRERIEWFRKLSDEGYYLIYDFE